MDAKTFVQKFEELRKKMPRIALLSSNSENSEYTNYAYKNKNCYLAFGSHYNEDSLYLQYCWQMRDCDCIGYDPSELLYECIGNSGNFNCNFCYSCWHNSDLEYCEHVFHSHHCFGCISRSHAAYEILNEKYSEADYFQKVAEIKAALRHAGLYGQWLLPSTYPAENTISLVGQMQAP